MNTAILQNCVHTCLEVLHASEDGVILHVHVANHFFQFLNLAFQLLKLFNIILQHCVQVDGGFLLLLHALGHECTKHLIKFNQFAELGGDSCLGEVMQFPGEGFSTKVHGKGQNRFSFLLWALKGLLLLARRGGKKVVCLLPSS